MTIKLLLCLLFSLTFEIEAGHAQTVTLDYYFNHEVHTDMPGHIVRFHYLWEDTAATGFSILGKSFEKYGGRLSSLDSAPTPGNLKNSGIYIIVDPDSRKENPQPNFIEAKDVQVIAGWVQAGGILVLMANDSANADLPHLNRLAARFGMHFNDDLTNHVLNDAHFQDGAIEVTGNPVFTTAHKIFIKDAASITLAKMPVAVVKNRDNTVVMAAVKYGKGMVFAVGDPWLYNEYTNGRLPADFENDKAADDWARWLLSQAKH